MNFTKKKSKHNQTKFRNLKTKHSIFTSFKKMTTIQESYESETEFDDDDSNDPLILDTVSINYPKDKYHFVSFTFMLMGLACLLPWCFFTTATDYWMYKFRNTSLPYSELNLKDKTNLQASFGSWLSIASNFPAFLTLLLTTRLTKISEMYRNGISQISIVLIFVITSVFIYVDTDTYQRSFFAFTMVSVVILNIAGAIFQSGTIGLVALFPRHYMHSMVTGQAIAGVFAVGAQLLSMLGNTSPKLSALAFFLCAIIGLIFTFVCYILIHRTDFFKFHMRASREDSLFSTVSDFSNDSVTNLKLLEKIWSCALCVVLTFVVTLAVFPALSILVVSSSNVDNAWTGRFFLPLTCFLLYNTGDLCGRLSCGFLPLVSNGPVVSDLQTPRTSSRRDDLVLLTISAIRLAMVPFIMLCNAHPRSHLPVFFENDNYFIGFMTVLGFSNGFLFCGVMMLAPKFVPPLYQERVGTLLTVSVGAGCTLGSALSFPLVKAI